VRKTYQDWWYSHESKGIIISFTFPTGKVWQLYVCHQQEGPPQDWEYYEGEFLFIKFIVKFQGGMVVIQCNVLTATRFSDNLN